MAMTRKMGSARRFTLWGATYRYSPWSDWIRPEHAPSYAVWFEPVYIELWPGYPGAPPNALATGFTRNLARACVRFALGMGWMTTSREVHLGLDGHGRIALRHAA